jgi:hypothetical protein
VLGQLLERLGLEPPVEVEVHDRFLLARLARVHHRGDAAVRAAFEPHDRVQRALHAEALGGDRRARGVDEEREILGRRLQHGAGALVPVLLARRVEGADEHRVVAARRGEVEDPRELREQPLGLDRLGVAGGQAAQVRRGERAQRGRILRPAPVDQVHETGAYGRDGVLARLDRDSHPGVHHATV